MEKRSCNTCKWEFEPWHHDDELDVDMHTCLICDDKHSHYESEKEINEGDGSPRMVKRMKIIVDKKALNDALKQVRKSIMKKNKFTFPPARCVLLEAEGEEVFLTTTDLEQRVTIAVPCKVYDPGRALLDATRLSTLVNSFSAGDVTISNGGFRSNEYNAWVLSGDMEFKIYGFNPEEFPEESKIEKAERFKISAPDFLNLLDKTIFCVSLDDTRKVLHTVLFTGKNGKLRAVGTDGRRLSIGAAKQIDRKAETKFLLPKKVAQTAERLLKKEKEVIIEYLEKNIKIKSGNYTICSRITEGNYPNYKPLVLNYKKSVVISTETMRQQLKAVSVIGSDSDAFDLSFSANRVTIKTENMYGEARTSFKTVSRRKAITFSFNIGFILEVLNKIKDEAFEFCYKDENTQILIVSDDMEHVIMPMRNR